MAKKSKRKSTDEDENKTADRKTGKTKGKGKQEISRDELFDEYKYQVYQQAVERVFTEGKISSNEEMVLESMRETLEIPYEVHEKILEILEHGDTLISPVKKAKPKPKPSKKSTKKVEEEQVSKDLEKLTDTIRREKTAPRSEVRGADDRFTAYRKALELTLADGEITLKEMAILTGLRDALGISEIEHERLEKETREFIERERIKKQLEAVRAEKRKIAVFRDTEKKIKNMETQIRKAEKTGVDVAEVTYYISQAWLQLDEANYSKSKKYLTEARKSLQKYKKIKAGIKKIERLEQMLGNAKKLSVDTTAVEKMISQSRTTLETGDFTNFNKLEASTRTKLQELLKGTKSLNQIQKTEKLFEKAKKLGLDLSDIEELIREAKKNHESGKFKQVASKMTRVRKELRELERYEKSNKAVVDTIKLVDEAKERGIDVKSSESMLNRAKKDLETRKFRNIPQLVKDIRDELRVAEDSKKASDLIAEVDQLIKDVREAGAVVTNAEQFLSTAKTAFKNKNYYRAIHNGELARSSALDAKENFWILHAKSTISAINLLISEANEFGANTDEATKALKKAEEMFETKNFDELDAVLGHAEELAKSSLDSAKMKYMYEKASSDLSSVEDFIENSRKKGADVSEAENLLKRTDDLLSNQKFDELEVLIKDARESSNKALHQFQLNQANASIAGVETYITEAKEAGIDVSDAEELLKQAESLFQEEDFEALEKYISEAENVTRTKWTEEKARHASEAISTTQSLIEESLELGIDVTDAQQLLLEAEAQFKDADYDAVEDVVKRAEAIARSSWEDFRAQLAMEEINKLESLMEETQKLGADVSEAKKFIEEAKTHFKDKNFDETESVLKNAEALLESRYRELKRKDIKEILNNTNDELKKGKDMGVDMAASEKLYIEAKEMYDADQLELSVISEFVTKAQTTVHESIQNYINTTTQEALTSAGTKLQELKDTGVDVSEAEDLLSQAEAMFQEEDFSSVEEYIKKAESAAEDSRQMFFSQKFSNDILLTQRFIMDVKDMGGDVQGPLEELDLANTALKNKEFEAVDEHLESTRKMLDDIKEKQVVKNTENRIADLEDSLRDLEKTGLDLSDAQAMVEEAKTALAADDLKDVNFKIAKAEDIINKLRDEYLSSELKVSIANIQVSIDKLKNLGKDVTSAQENLDQAKRMIEEGKFGEAKSFMSKSKATLEEVKEEVYQKDWLTGFESAKQLLQDAKALGIDTSTFEQELNDAEKHADEGELAEAKTKLTQSEQKLREIYETSMQDLAQKTIAKVEDFISSTKSLGVDLTDTAEYMDKVKQALAAKEFDKVNTMTSDIEKQVDLSREKFIEQKIVDEIDPIKDDLEAAREIGATVRDAEEYLETATQSFKDANFEKALKFVERAKNFVARSRERVIKENHPRVDVRLVSSEFQDNEWNKLSMQVENNGVIDAKDVRFIFTGDYMEFREPPTIPLLKVGQPMNIEVGVKPTTAGEIPMEMKLFYYRDFDDNEYTLEEERQFDVKNKGAYVIEDVFLTYKNGLLITHETRKLTEDVQEDVFTSMLSAVQDFVKDSFYSKSKLDLNRLDFGDSKILIEKGNNVSIAVVLVGHEPTLLPLFMREVIREVEDTYADVLDDWGGIMEELDGANEIVKKLLNVAVEKEGDAGTLTHSFVSTVYNMAKNIKEMGTDPAEMEFLLESAVKSGSEGDFSSAWEYLDQAEEKGKIYMAEAFVEGKKIIENARETGLNVGEADTKLEKAQKYFREGNYEEVNKLLKNVTGDVKNLQEKSRRVMFNEQITIFEESLNEIESEGVDISGPKAYLLMARSAFDEGNYEKIENFLSRGQEEFVSLKDMHQQTEVTQAIERAEAVLAKVIKVGVEDTAQIEEISHMLERAREARDQNDFDTAVQYALNAKKTADSLVEETSERDSAMDALDSVRSIISASKAAGVDVSNAEDLLAKSKNAFEHGDYDSTQELTNDIMDMMEKLKKPFQTQITSNTINDAQNAITDAKEYGADVLDAESILKEAKALFEAENFEKAEENANDAIEAARIAKRKKRAELMREPLEKTRVLISNVKSIGADVSTASAHFQEAEEALNKLNLEVADELIKRAENVAEEARDKYLMDIASEAISLTEKQSAESEQLGVDITDARRMLNQAMEMFEDHEYIKAEQYASNASDLLEELKQQFNEKQALDMYKKASELSTEIKALGADISAAEVHLKLAKETFNKQDYILLKAHSENAIDFLREAKKPFMPKISRDAIAHAKNQIEAARSFGVEISEAEDLVEQAKKAMESEMWDAVEDKAKEAAKIAEEAKNLQYQNQIKTEINSLRGKAVQLESSGVDTSEISSHLQKAEIALEGKNYEVVGKFMKSAREWMKRASEQKNRDKVQEIINYSNALIKYIKSNLKDIGKEITPAEKQLVNAKKAFKAKKYTMAEKSALLSKEMVEKIKHKNLEQFLFVFKSLQTEEMVNSVRNIISDLKKKNIDTQEIKTFLKKAEFAFESDETYEKGKEYIIEAKLSAKEAMKKYESKLASKAISTAQSQIISVKRMGVNVKEAELFLEKSKIAYKAQEFQKSKLLAEKVSLVLKKAKSKGN